MKNLLRILMFILIFAAVFFASTFLMDQNEKYNLDEQAKVEETQNTEISGDDLEAELLESGDEMFSGDVEMESVSGEKLESGDVSEVIEKTAESLVSGDEEITSGEVANN